MNDILIGWKEIAEYLRVSEKTAMRYQKERECPIKKNNAGHPVIEKSTADEWRLKEQSV